MLETIFGADMPVAARLAIALVIVIGLIGAAAWMVRRFGAQRLGGMTRARQPRLSVIEAANIDVRRRLVLIRRDNTEHFVMIGGPTDVVIEGNIMRASPPRAAQAPHPPAAVDALPLGESPTRPLQGEPVARPQASRWGAYAPPVRTYVASRVAIAAATGAHALIAGPTRGTRPMCENIGADTAAGHRERAACGAAGSAGSRANHRHSGVAVDCRLPRRRPSLRHRPPAHVSSTERAASTHSSSSE